MVTHYQINRVVLTMTLMATVSMSAIATEFAIGARSEVLTMGNLQMSSLGFANNFGTLVSDATVLTGNLGSDDDVDLHTLTFLVPGTYRIESFGYAGGTMSNGSLVEAGGFDTILSLFDSSGALLVTVDDGGARIDPNTGESFDSAIQMSLSAGTYTLAITQYNNLPASLFLVGGFTREGDGNFTPQLNETCQAASFCDVSEIAPFNVRTNFYAVEVTAVPLPGALLLFGPALGLIATVNARRSAKIQLSA